MNNYATIDLLQIMNKVGTTTRRKGLNSGLAATYMIVALLCNEHQGRHPSEYSCDETDIILANSCASSTVKGHLRELERTGLLSYDRAYGIIRLRNWEV